MTTLRLLSPLLAALLVLPEPAAAQDSDADRIAGLMEAARGLVVPQAPAADDPDLMALDALLTGIAETRDGDALTALAQPDIKLSFGDTSGRTSFRVMMGEQWFWPEFQRLVAGGGVLVAEWDDQRGAIYPAAFELWPADLDPYEYVYGIVEGADLLASPKADAAVLDADIFRKILALGPPLEDDAELADQGWYHLCMAETGCGYARAETVRSPLDWRAIFVQDAPGAPWELGTFIAGD